MKSTADTLTSLLGYPLCFLSGRLCGVLAWDYLLPVRQHLTRQHPYWAGIASHSCAVTTSMG